MTNSVEFSSVPAHDTFFQETKFSEFFSFFSFPLEILEFMKNVSRPSHSPADRQKPEEKESGLNGRLVSGKWAFKLMAEACLLSTN